MENKQIFMQDMTWSEIEERLKSTDIALLPVGQTEQHGQHLPINVDNIMSKGIARRVAEATFDTAKPVVAPQIHFSYSDLPAFRSYPGVFSLRPEVLVGLYHDVALSLVRTGFKKIIFVSGHYPNPPYISEAMRQLTKETNALFACCDFFTIAADEVARIFEETNHAPGWGHACLAETSVTALFGGEVRKDKVKGHVPDHMKSYGPGISFQEYEKPELAYRIWGGYGNEPGPEGDPTGWSIENGERIVHTVIKPIIELVEDWKEVDVELDPDFLAKMKKEGYPVGRTN